MKKFLVFSMFFLTVIGMTSCHGVRPDADEEAVLTYKPWFFGHGGVDKDPVTTGCTWCCWTTSSEYFKITPVRYDEKFDDIYSNDRTPLDFNSYINIQIKKGKSPILLQNYGIDWYKNNIQVPYRKYTREEVSKYSPFDLISNREILNKIDATVHQKMDSLVEALSKTAEFPIEIKSVVTGAASPNEGQKEEMEKTAQMIQARTTESREQEMHQIREKTEQARAKADRAYMDAMGLSPEKFIQFQIQQEYIDMLKSKNGANLNILIGTDVVPVLNMGK